MRPTMISNFVSLARGARNDLRMLRYVFADHEECCFNMMSGKNIEQFRSQREGRTECVYLAEAASSARCTAEEVD